MIVRFNKLVGTAIVAASLVMMAGCNSEDPQQQSAVTEGTPSPTLPSDETTTPNQPPVVNEETSVGTNTPPRLRNDVVQLTYGTSLTAFNPLLNDTDADGDTLHIASVKANIGQVFLRDGKTVDYTPPSGYQAIAVIYYSVSDGKDTRDATLVVQMVAPITPVIPPEESNSGAEAVYSINLAWEAPQEREDGEGLMEGEIDGYEVAFKKVNEETFETIQVNNPAFEIAGLDSGEYLIKVASIDDTGLKSKYSSELRAVVE